MKRNLREGRREIEQSLRASEHAMFFSKNVLDDFIQNATMAELRTVMALLEAVFS